MSSGGTRALDCQAVCLPTCQSGKLHIWITFIMTVITHTRVLVQTLLSKIESLCVSEHEKQVPDNRAVEVGLNQHNQ